MKQLIASTACAMISLHLLLSSWHCHCLAADQKNSTDTLLAPVDVPNANEHSNPTGNDDGVVDIANLLNALGVSNCFERCLGTLPAQIAKLLEFKDAFDQVQEICGFVH